MQLNFLCRGVEWHVVWCLGEWSAMEFLVLGSGLACSLVFAGVECNGVCHVGQWTILNSTGSKGCLPLAVLGAHMWAEWPHHVPSRGSPIEGDKNRSGCITPAFSGSPIERDTGRSDYITPVFLGADFLVGGGGGKNRQARVGIPIRRRNINYNAVVRLFVWKHVDPLAIDQRQLSLESL